MNFANKENTQWSSVNLEKNRLPKRFGSKTSAAGIRLPRYATRVRMRKTPPQLNFPEKQFAHISAQPRTTRPWIFFLHAIDVERQKENSNSPNACVFMYCMGHSIRFGPGRKQQPQWSSVCVCLVISWIRPYRHFRFPENKAVRSRPDCMRAREREREISISHRKSCAVT